MNESIDTAFQTMDNFVSINVGQLSLCSIDDEQTALYQDLTVNQAAEINSYYLLEFVACVCATFLLYSNIFMFVLVVIHNKDQGLQNGSTPNLDINTAHGADIIIQYIIMRFINIMGIGMVAYVFINADTYKSISVTMDILIINAVIYKYRISVFAKYLVIHLLSVVFAAFLSILIFNDLIQDIATTTILGNTFILGQLPPINYSYLSIVTIVHAVIATGLVVLTNSTSSLNAGKRMLHKMLLIFMASITFGFILGPIGHIWPSLVLYVALLITRNDITSLNVDTIIAYLAILFAILIMYPLIALQIKYIWRKKYVRYIEYKT
jgi:hypothetical protein